jgi:anti-sigma regulatory factor (Ser/Thr protein kinase)
MIMTGPVDLVVDAIAHRSTVPSVRHLVGAWLEELAIDGPDGDELLLVATELTTNAIEASQSPESRVEVLTCVVDGRVRIDVSDDGEGFDLADNAGLPGPDSVRGRGLGIARALSDRLWAERVGTRTVVRSVRSLAD